MIFLCHWICHFRLTILSRNWQQRKNGCRGFNDSKYYVTVSQEKIGHIKCLCYVFPLMSNESLYCLFCHFSMIKKKNLGKMITEDSRCRNKVNKCLWICLCFVKSAEEKRRFRYDQVWPKNMA
jgi:hypothetical protein